MLNNQEQETIMESLLYPFDQNQLMTKKKSIKKQLLNNSCSLLNKKIAILGGSTTKSIIEMLELFLLNEGIKPTFYESEYNQYWQDAMFDNAELITFQPDIIFIHTTSRNLTFFPEIKNNAQEINAMLEEQFQHFSLMWDHLSATYHCPIIQNNFERPLLRLLGNKDISDFHGKSNYIVRLNNLFYEYSQQHKNFYIHDIDYLSSVYGLKEWSNSFYWHTYKYALSLQAIPEFSHNLSNIIKSIFGKNKKSLVLDLDNTLWGGIIGDDGLENIELGPELPIGQAYLSFQLYLKHLKEIGILLTICSKNDESNALLGLQHPNSILTPKDFVAIKANWKNKDQNLCEIADELSLGVDSFVFMDDNPAERMLVKNQISQVAVPNLTAIEEYPFLLDRNGFFEVTAFSQDDFSRTEMYHANAKRKKQQSHFLTYDDYLKSLDMKAFITSFDEMNLARIAQLTNKSNQFNLTTKRYTQNELQDIIRDPTYLTFYGKLYDKFGDNGVVSLIIGKLVNQILHIDLWLMSCRVLKRGMEYAMFDELIRSCHNHSIEKIIGYYYLTPKNGMVSEFYKDMGFMLQDKKANGDSQWIYHIANHQPKNHIICIEDTI